MWNPYPTEADFSWLCHISSLLLKKNLCSVSKICLQKEKWLFNQEDLNDLYIFKQYKDLIMYKMSHVTDNLVTKSHLSQNKHKIYTSKEAKPIVYKTQIEQSEEKIRRQSLLNTCFHSCRYGKYMRPLISTWRPGLICILAVGLT